MSRISASHYIIFYRVVYHYSTQHSFIDNMKVTLEGQRKESIWVSMRRQRARRALVKKIMIRPRKSLEASRRPCRAIHRRVKTLKELVPNTKTSEGLDGLFRQTADYILALEMKVRVMQTMVQVLTESDCV
ncbi:PREDICTED: transcription factor UPBEAT1-like [Camelina sativa]|uniref:Transcription factor UPBEAT1-like n=1 Tax=Camelina sativa TaxID=90675 RepID=A0ABM0YYG8_CAMSA|nr:PREDICTED: transcription factor UPBEAT1-like [Camelina sativa]